VGEPALARFAGLLDRVAVLEHNDAHGLRAYTFRVRAKWSRVTLSERAASQEHFLDLCRMLSQPTPAEHDATGAEYTFEKGVAVSGPASTGARGERGPALWAAWLALPRPGGDVLCRILGAREAHDLARRAVGRLSDAAIPAPHLNRTSSNAPHAGYPASLLTPFVGHCSVMRPRA